MGLETDDVFSQGLKSPECVKILFNCLQNLETKMKSIKEISLAAKTGNNLNLDQWQQLELGF